MTNMLLFIWIEKQGPGRRHPDISTRAHLENTVRLVATCRIRFESTITHVLNGIEAVPEAFEITTIKRKYQAINPAQVVMRSR